MIITKDSHLDHGLSGEHIRLIFDRFGDKTGFHAETIDMGEDVLPVMSDLYGPAAGDPALDERSVHYIRRAGRAGDSRMTYREPRQTRLLTVIMGPTADAECVLYTAYGGPMAPREPYDASLDDKGREESKAFWSQHALSRGRQY